MAVRAPPNFKSQFHPDALTKFCDLCFEYLNQLWHLKGLIQADFHDYYLVTLDLPRPAALATQPTDSISPWRFDEILWALFWQLFDSVLLPAMIDTRTCDIDS